MRRPISIAGWCLLGAWTVVPLGCVGCVVSCGLLLQRLAGPDPDGVLAKAQPVCQPIITALTEFHRRHGRYPRELASIVREGFLTELPELPPHWGTSARYGPTYEVSESLDLYRLTYSYVVEGGIGPGDDFSRSFISDEPQGWSSGASERIEDLVAKRLLATYRNRHDEKTLALFMSEVIGKCDCGYLYREDVIGWLGDGDEIDLPSKVAGSGKKGYIYQSKDDSSRRYCFIYKDQWLTRTRSKLSAEERYKDPKADGSHETELIDKSYTVLDKLFLVQESDGDPIWTVIRECPQSPRDQPSGRHAIHPGAR